MQSFPAALALLISGAALTGVAVAAPGLAPGERRLPDGTVATQAGPRQVVAVLPSGSPAGVPPGPAGDPGSTSPEPGTPAGTPMGASGTGTGTGFGWPVAGPASMLRAFAPGPNPWSAGHRGVDVAGAGSAVLAAGPGTVTFAGSIAGRGVVVVEHAAGLRTTYEPVFARVAVGRTVQQGDPIGSLQTIAGHCAQGPCLHWGAKIGDRYLDPVSLVARPRRPPVLLPLPPGAR